jgi:hypothetical protein
MISLEGSDLRQLDDAAKKSAGMLELHNKWYWQVAPRLAAFKKSNPTISVITEIITLEETHCVMQARLTDENGLIHGIGHALEGRSDRGVNSTSYLENAETSAIGRALASTGWSGGEYASAEELLIALENQSDNYKEALWLMAMGDPSSFSEYVSGLSEEQQTEAFSGAAKGKITHFKNRWRSLQSSFSEALNSYAEALMQHCRNDDADGVKEVINELTEYEVQRVKDLISTETNHKISLMVKGS